MDDLPQGIYERVISKALEKSLSELSTDPNCSVDSVDIDEAESTTVLSRYIQPILEKGLKSLIAKTRGKLELKGNELKNATLNAEIEACNKIIQMLSDASDDEELLDWRIGESGKQLRHIWKEKNTPMFSRPRTSLSISELFTGGHQDLSLSDELCREIESSDEVYLLVSFIKMSGLRLIIDSLKKFVESEHHKLYILTTTYMGASEAIAIERLSELPHTRIKISYDSKSTRLHAKAYIFKRKSKFSTVYIGSSNLSRAAISEGLEWNIKLTNQDAPQVIDAALATFRTYWDSPDFEIYTPKKREKLYAALNEERTSNKNEPIYTFKLQPLPFQKELLEELKTEREIHNSYRNLVVAATGTGKTMLAAFDYQEFVKNNPDSPNSLLYIAQSKEILQKSLASYRAVLRNSAFGDIFSGENTPTDDKHVFMTISLFAKRRFDLIQEPDYYDYIVIDEVHHGAADSYQAIFDHYKPKILLGMTATPERSDEKSILKYFNERIAVEIRLPEAINREFLVPFHYFGILDIADISSARFEKGKFNTEDLEAIYNNNSRAQFVVDKVKYYWPYINTIRCIGFCVSVAHAEFMAEFFNKCGFKAMAVHGNTRSDVRQQAPFLFSTGKINFIFTVDLYNEGVDIPEINTILFLRPTESLTIFIQQLGRGLRTHDGKSELLVLDFIGQFNNIRKKNYRMYEKKIRYLTSESKKGVKHQILNGFSGLPMGCNIKLEEKVPRIILDAIPISKKKQELLEFIKNFSNGRLPSFKEFIQQTDQTLQSFYETYTFTELCICAYNGELNDNDNKLFRNGLRKLCFIDSLHWIDGMLALLKNENPIDEDRLPLFKSMFYYSFLDKPPVAMKYKTFDGFIEYVKGCKNYRNEIISVLEIRKNELKFIGNAPDVEYPCGLDIHCKYFRKQILAGLGINAETETKEWREGVLNVKELKTDLLLVTLNKSEKDFSPSTRYADYPISESRFHWQTQSRISEHSETGQRYIHHKETGGTILLFVREDSKEGNLASPFMFLGKCNIESHEDSKPMNIVWKMKTKIPAEILAYSPVRN